MSIVYQDEFAIRERFRNELLDGESLEWVGQPEPSVVFSKADFFLIPFGLFWLYVSRDLATDIMHFTLHDAFDLLSLLNLIPLLIGIYLVFGRFVYVKWLKKHMYYAVTNKRILILKATSSTSLEALFLSDIPVINKLIRRDGIGTVVFGPMNVAAATIGMGFGSGSSSDSDGQRIPPTFYDIHGADEVYALVNQLRSKQ